MVIFVLTKSVVMNEKILETAKKLKALSDRGVDGEKENAIEMLSRFMQKHGITAEMIEGRIIKKHIVFLEPMFEKRFFAQICASVLGGGYSLYRYTYKLTKARENVGKFRYGIECTDAEFIEIEAKHEFFFNCFLEDMDIFRSAFIQKNQLYQKSDDSDNEDTETPQLTPEEKAKLFKMANMMMGMDKKEFLKQIA